MSDKPTKERSFLGIPQLSLRSLVLGALGSIVITASSMYVALRLSALPWPTVFVAVLSMALLKILGRTTLNEINITQTAMSAGAMVAGGLAFTIPGLWISKVYLPYDSASGQTPVQWMLPMLVPVMLVAFAGMILGTLYTWSLRKRSIENENLPYPIGTAAAETLIVGDKGGRKSVLLFVSMGAAAVFTYLRDASDSLRPLFLRAVKLPALFPSTPLLGASMISMWLSPMAAGIGYIIGTLYTAVWFLGSALAYFVIVPLGPLLGVFASTADAVNFKNLLGLGLMVGTGVGILVSLVIAPFRKAKKAAKAASAAPATPTPKRRLRFSVGLLVTLSLAVSFVLTLLAGIGPVPALLLMVGVGITTAMAATITGQTGINPMEVFGILVLLAVRLVVPVDTTAAFFIAAAVAVACGYAGDLLNDYKAGAMIGTNPTAQLVSQIVGGVFGTVIAVLGLFAVIYSFGGVGGSTGLSAAQAFAVTGMVKGLGDPFLIFGTLVSPVVVFGGAVTLGAALYLFKVPAMTLGIGIYLPFYISSIVFLGGIVRFVMDRVRPGSNRNGNIVASGFLGGEGIMGVLIALVAMFSGK